MLKNATQPLSAKGTCTHCCSAAISLVSLTRVLPLMKLLPLPAAADCACFCAGI